MAKMMAQCSSNFRGRKIREKKSVILRFLIVKKCKITENYFCGFFFHENLL